MPRRLRHSEVVEVVSATAQANVVNMDASIRSLVEPTASAVRLISDEVALHVLCCNEYGFVTGAVPPDLEMADIREQLQSLRSALEQQRRES